MKFEACDAALAGDLFNKTITEITQEEIFLGTRSFFNLNEDTAFETYKKWEAKNSDGNIQIGARFPVKKFPVGIDIGGGRKRGFQRGEFNEAFRNWKQIISEEINEQEEFSFSGYYASFVRDSRSIEAWETCVTSIASQSNEPEILGYGFRDKSENAFIKLDWVPGEFLAEDIALLNIDTFGETSIGGQFEPDFQLAPGSGILFPIITNEKGSFSVLANVKVIDKDDSKNVKGLFQTNLTVPPIQLPEQDPTLKILVHLQDIGDLIFQENELAGTRDESRRLEGFQIEFVPPVPDLSMRYMAHLQDIGDVDFVNQGIFIGTRGESRRLEGFAIELTGARAGEFDIFYSAFLGISTFGIGGGVGDTPVFSNGQFCGTRAEGRILSGMKVEVRKKPSW